MHHTRTPGSCHGITCQERFRHPHSWTDHVHPLQTIHISYTGIVDITNEMRRILGRSSNARSTDFGNSCMSLSCLDSVRWVVSLFVRADDRWRKSSMCRSRPGRCDTSPWSNPCSLAPVDSLSMMAG
jgi:hypothetical protein